MIKQSGQGMKNSINEQVNILVIFKALIVSYIITIPILIIFSLILTYIDYPSRLISPVVVITTIISVLVAGSTVTKNARSKGWLNGGIVGFVYMFVLYILSSIIYNNFLIDKYVITMTVIGVLTGAIGGILGINLKKSSHSNIKYKRVG